MLYNKRIQPPPAAAKAVLLIKATRMAGSSPGRSDRGHRPPQRCWISLRYNVNGPAKQFSAMSALRGRMSKTSNVLDVVATRAPDASVTVPSVNAAREPDLTTVPVAVRTPLENADCFKEVHLHFERREAFSLRHRRVQRAPDCRVQQCAQDTPPITVPAWFKTDSSGVQVNTALPRSA